MADYFLGEIRMFALSYAPENWAVADGAILQISQNLALNSLYGTTYGGDGIKTFAIPDLRGRVPVSFETSKGIEYKLGLKGGAEQVILAGAQIYPHDHDLRANTQTGATGNANNAVIAAVNDDGLAPPNRWNLYGAPSAPLISLDMGSLSMAGGSMPHGNMQPYVAVNYCVALRGNYPPRP